MKKMLCIVFSLVLILPSLGLAEIDLSSLSFDDLVYLRQRIYQELITRPEWKEVTVPQGIWEVGVDIPAGHWIISAAPGEGAYVKIGTVLTNTLKSIDQFYSMADSYYFSQIVRSSSSPSYNPSADLESFDIDLIKGAFVQIEWASVVFTPYTGKPSLGF